MYVSFDKNVIYNVQNSEHTLVPVRRGGHVHTRSSRSQKSLYGGVT